MISRRILLIFTVACLGVSLWGCGVTYTAEEIPAFGVTWPAFDLAGDCDLPQEAIHAGDLDAQPAVSSRAAISPLAELQRGPVQTALAPRRDARPDVDVWWTSIAWRQSATRTYGDSAGDLRSWSSWTLSNAGGRFAGANT